MTLEEFVSRRLEEKGINVDLDKAIELVTDKAQEMAEGKQSIYLSDEEVADIVDNCEELLAQKEKEDEERKEAIAKAKPKETKKEEKTTYPKPKKATVKPTTSNANFKMPNSEIKIEELELF